MINLFKKYETDKYVIIKILFIKITFKKKPPKSDIDAIVWWIPFKNLRNAIRNIYYEYKNNINQSNNSRINNLYSDMHRRFDDLYPFMWDRFGTIQNNFNEQKKELLISRNLNYQSLLENKKLYFENIKNMPLVSVIIPVYNIGEKYLRHCLESVINQTLTNIEIIIVNDCSPLEEDEKIILEYKNKDKRIKYIKNEKNLGLAQSRIEGLKVATGYAVSFIDSDDFASLSLYEITVYEMLKNNVDIVCYNFFRVQKTADGNALYDNSFFNDIAYQTFYNEDIINLFCNSPILLGGYTWTKLVKRDILLNLGFYIANGMKNCIYNDMDLTFKIFISSKSMLYLPLNLHFYITNRETAVTNMYSLKDSQFTDLYTLYCDLYNFIEKKSNSNLTKLLASNLEWIYYKALEFDNYKVKENNHFISVLEKVILDLVEYGAIDKNQLLENVKDITNDKNLINWLMGVL